MPPAAVLGIGMAASGIGSALSQRAANKGPRALFPGLQGQALQALGGSSGLGSKSFGAISDIITNPGAMPDVSGTVNPAFQALYNANKQFVDQGRANLRERFGVSGLSASSPAAIAESNYNTQSNADFMNILAQYTLQAQEFAKSLQLSAATTGLNAFLGPAFTEVGPKGSVLGAGLGSAGDSLQTLALLKALGMFGPSKS